VIVLAIFYSVYGELEALRRILAGVACAAAGLIIAMVVKMGEPVLRHRFTPGPVLLVATFVAVGLLRWPLPMVLAVLAPVSVGLAFWWGRR
jgi:chromate transporter